MTRRGPLHRRIARVAIAFGTLLVQACATTNPGSSAGIDYRLPRTDVAVTLGIDVTHCTPLAIDATLGIDAIAGAQDAYWHIPGSALSSFFTQRALTVEVDDNGVISSINDTATDMRTAMLGDVVKLVATLAALPGVARATTRTPRAAVPLDCKDDTKDALAVVGGLESRLAQLQQEAPKSRNPVAARKNIDAVAAMLVSARSMLHQDVAVTVQPEAIPAVGQYPLVLDLDRDALGQIFDHVDDDSVRALNVYAWATEIADPTNTFPAKPTSSCEQAIVLPYAKPVKITLWPAGDLFAAHTEVSQTIYASQLGGTRDLCISAGFGENRTVSLKMDKFGRVSEFTWNSDARGANITGALAGAAPDVASAVTAIRDRKVNKEKQELDRINTEIQLRQARECLAKLQAGSSCKDDAE
jgi:hypothetical protein